MKGIELAVIVLFLVAAGLGMAMLFTAENKSGAAVVVPEEFKAKEGEVAPVAVEPSKEGSSLVGRAFETALFSAEKAALSPSEASRSQAPLFAIAFVSLVIVACVAVWVRSR